MPTSHPRTLITRTPQVERIIAAGRRRWPGKSAAAILVGLAEERAAELQDGEADPMSLLMVFPATGHTITNDMVEAALADEG
jgi:hypothetical protein